MFAGLLIVLASALAQPTDDPRFCGPPLRDVNGEIVRSRSVLNAFRRIHPCPAPDAARPSACPGWVMDHVVPLSCGGCDMVDNLQWLPEAQWRAKTLWERKVYGGHQVSKGCP